MQEEAEKNVINSKQICTGSLPMSLKWYLTFQLPETVSFATSYTPR
jgi:hypothetical protein